MEQIEYLRWLLKSDESDIAVSNVCWDVNVLLGITRGMINALKDLFLLKNVLIWWMPFILLLFIINYYHINIICYHLSLLLWFFIILLLIEIFINKSLNIEHQLYFILLYFSNKKEILLILILKNWKWQINSRKD